MLLFLGQMLASAGLVSLLALFQVPVLLANLWACIYGVLLTGYAAFTLLDAFVIPRDLVYMGEMGKRMDVAGTGELDGMEDLEEAENIGNGQNVQDELSPGNGTLQEETPSEEIPSEETPPDGLQSETLV